MFVFLSKHHAKMTDAGVANKVHRPVWMRDIAIRLRIPHAAFAAALHADFGKGRINVAFVTFQQRRNVPLAALRNFARQPIKIFDDNFTMSSGI
jgi:hypothetical protein